MGFGYLLVVICYLGLCLYYDNQQFMIFYS